MREMAFDSCTLGLSRPPHPPLNPTDMFTPLSLFALSSSLLVASLVPSPLRFNTGVRLVSAQQDFTSNSTGFSGTWSTGSGAVVTGPVSHALCSIAGPSREGSERVYSTRPIDHRSAASSLDRNATRSSSSDAGSGPTLATLSRPRSRDGNPDDGTPPPRPSPLLSLSAFTIRDSHAYASSGGQPNEGANRTRPRQLWRAIEAKSWPHRSTPSLNRAAASSAAFVECLS